MGAAPSADGGARIELGRGEELEVEREEEEVMGTVWYAEPG